MTIAESVKSERAYVHSECLKMSGICKRILEARQGKGVTKTVQEYQVSSPITITLNPNEPNHEGGELPEAIVSFKGENVLGFADNLKLFLYPDHGFIQKIEPRENGQNQVFQKVITSLEARRLSVLINLFEDKVFENSGE